MNSICPRTAAICGISGQDGAYMAQLLLSKGYRVIGTACDAQMSSFANLDRLGIRNQATVVSMAINDFRSVLQMISRHEPAEVYNFAGQSSVGLSFDQPVETLESICIGTLNLLEVIRFLNRDIRFYNASSGECFGDTGDNPANENTPFRPRSPYAVAKAAAFWQLANHHEAYGLYTCSEILCNHESPLRPERFVTQKIVRGRLPHRCGQRRAAAPGQPGHSARLGLGAGVRRCHVAHAAASGAARLCHCNWRNPSLQDFVTEAFKAVGMDWRDHVETDAALMRPTDIRFSRANPALAAAQIGWVAQKHMKEVVRGMVLDEQLMQAGNA